MVRSRHGWQKFHQHEASFARQHHGRGPQIGHGDIALIERRLPKMMSPGGNRSLGDSTSQGSPQRPCQAVRTQAAFSVGPRCGPATKASVCAPRVPGAHAGWPIQASHALPNRRFWEAEAGQTRAKCLILLVGVQGFEPWTR